MCKQQMYASLLARVPGKALQVAHCYVGQRVSLAIDALSRSLHIYLDHHLPKGFLSRDGWQKLTFEEFVTDVKQQA
jgi:hypothetical protein